MAKDISKETSNLVELLFRTEAFQVCPEGKPFWYTSGNIGPYYVNTHYLYGSKSKADELLSFIEEVKDQKQNISELVFEKVLDNYDEDDIFRLVIDTLVETIKANEDLASIDYISGGERRDWFFSIIIAYILKKPHITIFKSLDTIVWDSVTKRQYEIKDGPSIKDKKVLHVADLITEASSYERAWIPAIKGLGAVLNSTYVIIDRMQGGRELLRNHDVEMKALINIDESLFLSALNLGLINNSQLDMLKDYFRNPHLAMKNFLTDNPGFLEEALKSDGKSRERAQLCVNNKIYA